MKLNAKHLDWQRKKTQLFYLYFPFSLFWTISSQCSHNGLKFSNHLQGFWFRKCPQFSAKIKFHSYCLAKYACLKCNKFASNRSSECFIPASEEIPGWKECKKVALCLKCDKEEHISDEQQKVQKDDPKPQGREKQKRSRSRWLQRNLSLLAHREELMSIETSAC